MNSMTPIGCQYRSFDSIYLLNLKNKGKLSLKILDVSQKCLFKKTFTCQDLSLSGFEKLMEMGDAAAVLERLAKQKLIPEENFIPKDRKVTQNRCEEVLEQAIEQFKPKILVERKEMEGFICPITLQVFQNPVIDQHGHTFEKSAIEEHLKRKNTCPLNNQPIHSLTPNRLVQQTIEEWKQQDPIPNFSLFKKENPQLANMNLQLAQTYMESGEYEEALGLYAKAFQYTKSCADYAPLISLFEKMEEYEKATLAYLYLAKYQLQAGNIQESIQILQNCQKGKSAYLQNNLILIELYYYIEHPKRALHLSIHTAEALAKQNPSQAILLYRSILQNHPAKFSLYSHLASLLESPQEKTQTLLKGALQAMLVKNHEVAEGFIKEVEGFSEPSYVDSLVTLALIRKQGKPDRGQQGLLYLAKVFEEKKLIDQMLPVYKMLFQLERDPEYCQKILFAYKSLQKPQKEFDWSLTYLSLLIEKSEWEKAEALAKDLLQKTQDPQQKIFLYEKLEGVYTHWRGHEFESLWPKLGKAYHETKQLDSAKKTYQKAFERFHHFEDAIALAEVLKESRHVKESVQTYYKAAVEALLEQSIQKLSLCIREIKQIDPRMQCLGLNQKMHLLAQEHILTLSKELAETQQELSYMKRLKAFDLLDIIKNPATDPQVLEREAAIDNLRQLADASLRKELPIKCALLDLLEDIGASHFARSAALDFFTEISEGSLSIQEKRRLRQLLTHRSAAPLYDSINALLGECSLLKEAFGKNDWETFFGPLGEIPPLPSHIEKLLKSACPFHRGSLIGETHILVLMPQKVGGEFLTFNQFSDLVGNSEKGKAFAHKKHQDGNETLKESYWMLMTKDVIPLSLNTHGMEKIRLIDRYPSYELPTALEAAVGITMYYLRYGNRIYNHYTLCPQKGNKPNLAVGGSAGGGFYCNEMHNHMGSLGITGVLRLTRISHHFSGNSHTQSTDLPFQPYDAALLKHCPHPAERQSRSTMPGFLQELSRDQYTGRGPR